MVGSLHEVVPLYHLNVCYYFGYSELKGIRQQICTKSVEVVWSSWLEDCNEQKQEVVITEKHHVADGLLLKGIMLKLFRTQKNIMFTRFYICINNNNN